MVHEIIWSDEAQEDYTAIVNYLLDGWSFEVADAFTDELSKKIAMLEQHPYTGHPSNHLSSVRRILVTPYQYLYYSVIKNQIFILNLVDTRKSLD